MENQNSNRIPFKVSARTARLIGRENIATSKGAIIELVKNCSIVSLELIILNCFLFIVNNGLNQLYFKKL